MALTMLFIECEEDFMKGDKIGLIALLAVVIVLSVVFIWCENDSTPDNRVPGDA
jgi:hypothetical protein